MTIALREWLGRVRYHDVRHVERAAQVRLPQGGRLRGLPILRNLWIGRDKHFYFIPSAGSTVCRRLSDDDALSMASLLTIQLKWKSAAQRQERRMPVIKERRRRVVAARRR